MAREDASVEIQPVNAAHFPTYPEFPVAIEAMIFLVSRQ